MGKDGRCKNLFRFFLILILNDRKSGLSQLLKGTCYDYFSQRRNSKYLSPLVIS